MIRSLCKIWTLTLCVVLIGCESIPDGDVSSARSGQPRTATVTNSNATATRPPASTRPLAYVDGQPITLADLEEGLLEAVGGQVLAELTIDRAVEQRLRERGLPRPTEVQVNAERVILGQYLARTIDPDPDQVARLLRDLRQRLGPSRFDRRLRRNAAMRLLVQDDVEMSEAAIQQRFELDYGRRYRARMIVVSDIRQAQRLIDQLREGASFIELASRHSTHSTRDNGGLLPPISPVNPNVPDAIVKTLTRLEPGEVSDPVVVTGGLAILQLESLTPAQDVALDDVRDVVEQRVRRDAELLFIGQLGVSLIRDADVVVLDPALRWSWDARRDSLEAPE